MKIILIVSILLIHQTSKPKACSCGDIEIYNRKGHLVGVKPEGSSIWFDPNFDLLHSEITHK